jgi:uncharacterized membrane protein
LIAAAIGAAAAGLETWLGPWDLAPLTGWVTTAGVLLGLVWLAVGRLDGAGTARLAAQEDPSAATADLLVLAAAVASLFAVGLVMVRAAEPGSAAAIGRICLGVVSVLLSWAVVHTVYALRYADLYYDGVPGGIEFNQTEPPSYADFGYLSFTIGMTYQVSDTALGAGPIRHTALRHALLSYLFGAVILAVAINLVANLIQ